MKERLQKIIAAAGLASRRRAEELITTGRVSVNGEAVTYAGRQSRSSKDVIRVDGAVISCKPPFATSRSTSRRARQQPCPIPRKDRP
jgi:23S rRNA pseudouridine2605 synthase